eukprot:6277712-Amphidinium_carterae.1
MSLRLAFSCHLVPYVAVLHSSASILCVGHYLYSDPHPKDTPAKEEIYRMCLGFLIVLVIWYETLADGGAIFRSRFAKMIPCIETMPASFTSQIPRLIATVAYKQVLTTATITDTIHGTWPGCL